MVANYALPYLGKGATPKIKKNKKIRLSWFVRSLVYLPCLLLVCQVRPELIGLCMYMTKYTRSIFIIKKSFLRNEKAPNSRPMNFFWAIIGPIMSRTKHLPTFRHLCPLAVIGCTRTPSKIGLNYPTFLLQGWRAEVVINLCLWEFIIAIITHRDSIIRLKRYNKDHTRRAGVRKMRTFFNMSQWSLVMLHLVSF